jgi:hypothetical protein
MLIARCADEFQALIQVMAVQAEKISSSSPWLASP